MNKKNEKQIMIEQVSMQVIMRIRQIIQEMSKYSKYILPRRSLPTRPYFNWGINKNCLFE
jgi:hypothetical protein